MKKYLLVALLVILLTGAFLANRFGVGGPSQSAIHAAIHERLSKSIELSKIDIERSPPIVIYDDQLVTYSANAVIHEDYVTRLNPFDWQDQCEGGREGRTVDKSLSGTAVYEIIAKQGSTLTLIGRMKGYREDGEWVFTARNRRLMDGDSRINGSPLSAVKDALLTNSDKFDQLCDAVFLD
ncbi:MAG: hypothetical protein KTR35_24860 [Gammaproteobacteria bacterium]|nr:hypothetical protein [Gammaproteobacteria bacterium]